MSGFGGKADIAGQPLECPLLARTRHSSLMCGVIPPPAAHALERNRVAGYGQVANGQPLGRSGLHIGVDERHRGVLIGERTGQVDSNGRLADPALHRDERDLFCHR